MCFKLYQKVDLKLFQGMTKIPFTLRHVLGSVIVVSNWENSLPEVFLGKGILKTCSKITGEHPYRSVIYCEATLLKSHFGMGVLLWIYCIFSEQLFLGTPLSGCFWEFMVYCLKHKFSNKLSEVSKKDFSNSL